MRFAAIGLDHRHIFHMVGELLAAGASCAGYCTATSDPRVLAGFQERFPQLQSRDRQALLNDPTIDAVVCASIPCDRPALAVQAMRRGKDVMLDKPGVTRPEHLAELERAVLETGRFVSICFSERFVVPATIVAQKLIEDGAIGPVVQTIGLGPHRLNRAIRPPWFFETERSGGILNDVASHQIDQFLAFTDSSDARIVTSAVGHFGSETGQGFQDFGELVLESEQAAGYVRVDWFTPDGLPTWGDGRLIILGQEGTIELRKYVDVAGRSGTDHVLIADRAGVRHIDASTEPLTYFRAFMADVLDRTETAMPQAHVFTVCRLALAAQAQARLLPARPRRADHS